MSSNKIIHWSKHNIPLIAAGAVGLASVAATVVVAASMRPSLLAQVGKDADRRLQDISAASSYGLPMPGANPGDDLLNEPRTPSKSLLGKYDEYAKSTAGAAAKLEKLVLARNALRHDKSEEGKPSEWLIAEGILPENTSTEAPVLVQHAKDRYAQLLQAPLADVNQMPATTLADIMRSVDPSLPVPMSSAMPYLRSGRPLPATTLEQIMRDAAERRVEVLGGGKLTDDQHKQVVAVASGEVVKALQARAASLTMYADPDLLRRDMIPWTKQSGTVLYEMAPIYESQMEVWILRDVLESLARANRSASPDSNVTNAPVKRLIELRVLRDGYVGLHSAGVSQHPANAEAVDPGTAAPSATPVAATGVFNAFGAPRTDLPPVTKPQPRNFAVSPSGRMSNAVYDVRHVRLDVVVDLARMDELFKAIADVNLMSVVDCSVADIDVNRDIRNGYYYGESRSLARVSLTIETVWMRAWTTKYMPSVVRAYLKA